MRSYLVAVGLLAITVTPALADEFYVGQNIKTRACDIFDVKPDGTTIVMVGTTSYPSRQAAKDARNSAPECGGNKKKDNKKR
jgi:hypothetical protein